MRVGDVSRRRRFSDPARQAWYAYRRSVRFALRMRRGGVSPTIESNFIPLLAARLAAQAQLGLRGRAAPVVCANFPWNFSLR